LYQEYRFTPADERLDSAVRRTGSKSNERTCAIMSNNAGSRLERSCRPQPGDWVRQAPQQPGLHRLEAFFQGHAYEPHRHDTYAIGITLSGVQSFNYRGAKVDSKRGNVMVLHPDEKHDGHSAVETGFCYRMLYLAPRLLQEALDCSAADLPFVAAGISSDPRLSHAVWTALADLNGPLAPLEVDETIAAIADALLAQDASAGRRARRPVAPCPVSVRRARQYLEERAERLITSEELEQVSGSDRYTLARHFRAWIGTSPYRYLTMRRLERARAAILSGSSLSDAAFRYGFADQSHLTRQFKKAFGVSPGRWRELQSASSAATSS
jgi:AraC-like DNA-binding protein